MVPRSPPSIANHARAPMSMWVPAANIRYGRMAGISGNMSAETAYAFSGCRLGEEPLDGHFDYFPGNESMTASASDPYRLGDHLKVRRRGYTHHGIYVGNGRVVHYSGKANGVLDRTGNVCEVLLSAFAGPAAIEIVPARNRRYTRQESVERAASRLGEVAYSVSGNNCEHFVEWCISGIHGSRQVDLGASVTTGTGYLALGTGTAAATAGRGGAKVMSGLKTVGLGSAARGLNVAAAAGAIGGDVLVSQTFLKDDDALDEAERRARRIGRWSGRVAGTGSSLAAAAVVTGSAASGAAGGAAVTSGLATVGALMNGGMAAGVGLTVAGPFAIAVGVAYGAYKLAQS